MNKEKCISYLSDVMVAAQRYLFFDTCVNSVIDAYGKNCGTLEYYERNYSPAVHKISKKDVLALIWDILRIYTIPLAIVLFFVIGVAVIGPESVVDVILYIVVVVIFLGLLALIWFRRIKPFINEVQDAKKTVEARNNEAMRTVETLKTLVPAQESRLKFYQRNRADAKETLDRLYNTNILYPAYRNYDAVYHILQYLASGRCDELYGPNGAYNKYELERRLDRIICSLNDINASINNLVPYLSSIGSSVNSISNTMISQSQTLASLSSKLDNIYANLDSIDEVAKLSKIQNEQIARAADYTAFAAQQNRLETGHFN